MQVALADRLLVTKTDLATSGETQKVQAGADIPQSARAAAIRAAGNGNDVGVLARNSRFAARARQADT